MKRYPIRLQYVDKTALWGGRRLCNAYGKATAFDRLSETWELTVRDCENNRILNGEAEGSTLGEYLAAVGYDAVSPTYDGTRFPLLIKFIDANDRLSVQVHPSDAYALAHSKDPGKTEMWHILEAKPDAKIIYGLADGVDAAAFAQAVRGGNIAASMAYVPVRAGETYFIPSGLLHAIGEGIVIAEIQQNSDLTYRVYDYDRRDAGGNLRPLHVQAALDVVRPFTEDEIQAIRFESRDSRDDGNTLAHCRYFRVYRREVDPSATLTVTPESFISLLCIDGGGTLLYAGERYPVQKGDSYFLPAGLGTVTLEGKLSALCSEV